MTILKKAQKEFERAIKNSPDAVTWSVKMDKSNLQVVVVLANSEKGREIVSAKEDGRILGTFIYDEKEYLVTR
jgi:hypothetical protein